MAPASAAGPATFAPRCSHPPSGPPSPSSTPAPTVRPTAAPLSARANALPPRSLPGLTMATPSHRQPDLRAATSWRNRPATTIRTWCSARRARALAPPSATASVTAARRAPLHPRPTASATGAISTAKMAVVGGPPLATTAPSAFRLLSTRRPAAKHAPSVASRLPPRQPKVGPYAALIHQVRRPPRGQVPQPLRG